MNLSPSLDLHSQLSRTWMPRRPLWHCRHWHRPQVGRAACSARCRCPTATAVPAAASSSTAARAPGAAAPGLRLGPALGDSEPAPGLLLRLVQAQAAGGPGGSARHRDSDRDCDSGRATRGRTQADTWALAAVEAGPGLITSILRTGKPRGWVPDSECTLRLLHLSVGPSPSSSFADCQWWPRARVLLLVLLSR